VVVEGEWVEAALAAPTRRSSQALLLMGKPVTRQVIKRVKNSNASRMPKMRQEYRNKPASPNSSTLVHDAAQ
jgi:hypothetical protein